MPGGGFLIICDLDEEQMEELRMISVFTDNELKLLRLKFKSCQHKALSC